MADDETRARAVVIVMQMVGTAHREEEWAHESAEAVVADLDAAGLLAAPAQPIDVTEPDWRRIIVELAAGLSMIAELVGLDRETDEPEVIVNRVRERLAAPQQRPHVNETSTGGYLARERIPGETYKDATADGFDRTAAHSEDAAEKAEAAGLPEPDEIDSEGVAYYGAGRTHLDFVTSDKDGVDTSYAAMGKLAPDQAEKLGRAYLAAAARTRALAALREEQR